MSVPEKGAASLLLVGSDLVVVCRREPGWMMSLYRSRHRAAADGWDTLASFSLPSAWDDAEGRTGDRRPVLTCVHSSDRTPPWVCGSPDGHCRVDPVLFKLLFGVDAALAGSPVVLVGLPDGGLYFLPLRSPGRRPRALYSLEQPVVLLGASPVDEGDPERARSLVAVGERGRVVLIGTRKGQQGEAGRAVCFLDRCVPGGWMCGCLVRNELYYGVGSDLLKLDLTGGSEEASRRTDQSSTSLGVSGVAAVAPLKRGAAGTETSSRFWDISHK